MRTLTFSFVRTVVVLSLVGAASPSAAAPILAGAAQPGHDAALAALAVGFQRQQDVFATAENGLSLDIFVRPGEVAGVRAFFAQEAEPDFKTFSGKHPFEVVDAFGEWGDEGNFAGVSSVGVAARLLALRAEGAPVAELARARASAVRAARAWHVYGSIGGPGVVARGIRRVKPEDPSAPPLPGKPDPVVPLTDGAGHALPAAKGDSWRAPVAAGFEGWFWLDNTSKDQVSGYALAAAWLWDALEGDPEVPADVTKDLGDDLAAFAKALMVVAPELGIDLCIRDADGRLTGFHDLNARQLSPDSVLPEDIVLRNGFNAALALGVVRAAYQASGDPVVGRYYYEELVGRRNYPSLVGVNAGAIFLGASTNFSNVNMLAIAFATLGRFETDPYVRSELGAALDGQFWSTGSPRDVSQVKQAWFDVVYAAGAPTVRPEIRARVAEDLGSFQPAPAFERDRVNCDAAEIAVLQCIGVDGTTVIELETDLGHGGTVVAKHIVPMAIRPDTDFEWRSDPHRINGSASSLMDPRGDWLAAYWMSRITDLEDATKNVSAKARPPLPYALGAGGAGGGAGGASGAGGAVSAMPLRAESDPGGCGCAFAGERGGGLAVGFALACLLAALRRRD